MRLVDTLFIAFVGAIALAVGIAFGLGGRETAAQLWQDWYERSRTAMPRIQSAARMTTSTAPASAGAMEHPLRRAADRGEAEPPGPNPMRRATDMAPSM